MRILTGKVVVVVVMPLLRKGLNEIQSQRYGKRKARLAEPGFSCEGVSRVASRSTFKPFSLLTLR